MKNESPRATYSNENDSESTKTNKSSAILDFMSKMLLGDELQKVCLQCLFIHGSKLCKV